MSRTLVTGGAGFIGSHVVDRLIADGIDTVVVDNLSNSTMKWIQPHVDRGVIEFHHVDILDTEQLTAIMSEGIDRVIHLAASVDMRVALTDNWIDVEQSILGTRSVLEAMRMADVGLIVFASSSTVYGEPSMRPTPETYGPLLPISVYGASKLAAEALISSYSHIYGIEGAIFRFGNVVGGRLNHGVIYDFINKLRRDSQQLTVLGNGFQRKNYFLAEDCADGLVKLSNMAEGGVAVANLGTEDSLEVSCIARLVSEAMGLDPVIRFGDESRGWPGDVPVVEFDLTRVTSLGWKASRNSEGAVRECTSRLLMELSNED